MAYLLIVDDDEDFAEASAIVLRSDGHEVKIELDIKSGEKSLQERYPDLLVLDVMFPESSSAGFDLARKIRLSGEKLSDIPILMLTAVNTEFPLGFGSQDIGNGWLPVEDFLEKPVDFDLLKKKVFEMLSQTDT